MILREMAREKGLDEPLDADTDMLAVGFDSFDFASLIPALEEALGFPIDLTNADVEEIVRIGGLAAFVRRQRDAGTE